MNYRRSLGLMIASVAALVLALPAVAQNADEGSTFTVGSEGDADRYRWKTAGGNYLDPTSFFSLHGYLNAVYAGPSLDWLTEDPATPGAPGQVLVPNTPESSFQWDAALFVASELSDRSRLMLEWHTVSDPSGRGAAGPGGLTLVMTEATASWDLVPDHLTMSGGLFWAPFATINRDWLGAQNLFTLVPNASGIFPAHLNEHGVRFDGAAELGPRAGVNYVVSVGNGTQSFDIGGQTSYDQDDDRTIVARVGVFPGLEETLEVGFSFARGGLRDEIDSSLPLDDPLGYASEFHAYALDAQVRGRTLALRGYAGESREDLSGRGAAKPNLVRRGAMLEARAEWVRTLPLGVSAITPKVRADYSKADRLLATGIDAMAFESMTYSVGLTVSQGSQMRLSAEYHFRHELNRDELRNNRFVVRMIGEF